MGTPNDTNIALMRDAFAEFNRGSVDACAARLTPDFIINIAGAPPMHGEEAWRRGVNMMRNGFPDIQADIEDIFGVGDRVAVRLTFRGTHRGEFLGVPATGRPVEYTSIELYRISEGLVAEEWICSDIGTLMRQIGDSAPVSPPGSS